jgi:hypothetical protein
MTHQAKQVFFGTSEKAYCRGTEFKVLRSSTTAEQRRGPSEDFPVHQRVIPHLSELNFEERDN